MDERVVTIADFEALGAVVRPGDQLRVEVRAGVTRHFVNDKPVPAERG